MPAFVMPTTGIHIHEDWRGHLSKSTAPILTARMIILAGKELSRNIGTNINPEGASRPWPLN